MNSGMQPWDDVLHWAVACSSTVDLDEQERDYKLVLSDRLAHIRDQVINNREGWSEELRKALGSSNLLNQYFLMPLTEKLKQQPDAMIEALLVIWKPEPSVNAA